MQPIRVTGAYRALLERVISRLEQALYRRLERLDANVAMHESWIGLSKPRSTATKQRRRAVQTGLAEIPPSVIVLGARLTSDKRFCKTLIQRVVGIFYESLARRIASVGPARLVRCSHLITHRQEGGKR